MICFEGEKKKPKRCETIKSCNLLIERKVLLHPDEYDDTAAEEKRITEPEPLKGTDYIEEKTELILPSSWA